MGPERILLSGANGYIAQHVLATFLRAGHPVRGVVRSEAKADQLRRTFQEYADTLQLEFSIVPDITLPGAFDDVLQSNPPFDVVLHTASPFHYRKNASPRDFIEPAVKGTTEILRSIANVAPTVKRVVITGSLAAVINPALGWVSNHPKVYTEADWNPITLEQAQAEGAPLFAAYTASKKFAEKAAWDFLSGPDKPGFDVVSLNAPWVFGPLYSSLETRSMDELGESAFSIYSRTLKPGLTESSPLAPTGVHLYVDVRDLAMAHFLAATVPAAGGHRFIICAEQGHLSAQRIANIFRETLPHLSSRLPKGEPQNWPMPEGSVNATSKLAKKLLGLRFRTPEETIGDMAVQLAKMEERMIRE